MKSQISIAVFFLLASVAAGASNQSTSDLIEQRQQAFEHIEDCLDLIEEAYQSDEVDWRLIQAESERVNQQSKFLLNAFPEGTEEDSRARRAIWQNWGDFSHRLSELDSGLERLQEAAWQQDVSGVKAAWDQADDTCMGCHRKYRSLSLWFW